LKLLEAVWYLFGRRGAGACPPTVHTREPVREPCNIPALVLYLST